MSWKDGLQRGSFRGVEFFIDTHSLAGGRRTVQHEFVDRDTPFAEDLGRKARNFTLEIHLIGDDYFQRRDQLIAALEQRGSGELIHPYLGQREVNVSGYSVSEDTLEGRIVRFSITFIEAGSNIFPSIEEDRAATLLDFAEASLDSAKEKFAGSFSVFQQPGFVVESAQALVEQAADAFESATSVIAQTTEDATELAFQIRNLKADALDLIQAPGQLADRLADSMRLLSSVATNADDASNSFSTMFEFGEDETENPFSTPTRDQENTNRLNFNNYIRDVAIISATEEAIDRNFATIQDALNTQQELKELLNRQSDTAEDINFFQNMNDLAASLVKTVPDVDNDLPNVVTVTLQDTTNSVVLAYDLFEDIDQEQEIIDRNNIRNPSFIVGGTELEVINA